MTNQNWNDPSNPQGGQPGTPEGSGQQPQGQTPGYQPAGQDQTGTYGQSSYGSTDASQGGQSYGSPTGGSSYGQSYGTTDPAQGGTASYGSTGDASSSYGQSSYGSTDSSGAASYGSPTGAASSYGSPTPDSTASYGQSSYGSTDSSQGGAGSSAYGSGTDAASSYGSPTGSTSGAYGATGDYGQASSASAVGGQAQSYGSPVQSSGYGDTSQTAGYDAYGAQPTAAPVSPYGYDAGYATPAPALADFGKRAVAGLIDYVAPGLVLSLVVGILGAAMAAIDNSGALSGIISLLGYVAIFGFLIWNTVLKGGNTGVTLGRSVAKIKMVSEATGQPIGALNAFLRHLCHTVDSLICYIGWLFPLWDTKRQTLADKIMKTVVVNDDGAPTQGQTY